MNPGYFQCKFCGKSFRWKPEIAGRSAKCKCGKKIHVPESNPAAESAGAGSEDASALADAIASLGSGAAAPPPPPAGRRGVCRACRRPMKPDAVLCLECGFNQQTGEAVHAQVQTLSTKDRRRAKWESGMAGLQFVRAGLWCNLAGLILYVGIIVGAIVMASQQMYTDTMVTALGVMSLLAVGCMWVSPLLCLMVPKESGARGMLWTSQILFTANAVLEFVGESLELPINPGVLGILFSLAGTLFLLMFFLKLAEYLDYGYVIEAAEKLIRSFVGLILLGLAILMPCIQCIAFIPFMGLLVYVAILYMLLLHTLTRAISVSLREDFC